MYYCENKNLTFNYIFDSILTRGDIMIKNSHAKRHYEYLNLKELFALGKYDEFLKKCDEYLFNYSDDINVRFMKAKSNRIKGNFDMAIYDLKYILNNNIDKYAIVELYYIYYHLGKYKEALELLPNLYENKLIKTHSLAISELVMKKSLGYDVTFKEGSRSDYIKFQIVDYDKEKALDHIKRHEIINDIEKDIIQSYFIDDLNIEYLYDLITENLQNNKKVNKDEVLDVYYFGISNIGVYKNQNCNYIKVVAIPDTTNIITIYPTLNVDSEYISDMNIDYDKLFNRQNKVKTYSQIDRFNKRFNRV